MAVSGKTTMTLKSYQNQAGLLLKNYLLADPFVPYTSLLGGILACKVVYDLSQLISAFYFRSYTSLTKIQRIEWNNRGLSTIHAIFIASMSIYFVVWSDFFTDQHLPGAFTLRSSPFSTFILGVSVGYFLSDLGMICWLYPSLGGLEYIVHHSLSGIAVAYSAFSGEGQLYTFMVLISEMTTPAINFRWYLDTAGLKRSTAYVVNGVAIFFGWLGWRILLFIYMFYHVYTHYDQIFFVPHACWNYFENCTLKDRSEGCIYFKLLSGPPDAHLWLSSGTCCALCTCHYELDVVWENYQRAEKDVS